MRAFIFGFIMGVVLGIAGLTIDMWQFWLVMTTFAIGIRFFNK